MAKSKVVRHPRRHPASQDFVRMMEAWAAMEMDEDGGQWSKVYRMAHVCFSRDAANGGQEPACPHPEWEKEFWKQYDAVKNYWEEK